jgi:protein-S-isoprenylcysteine O-methyltransferase Ste14
MSTDDDPRKKFLNPTYLALACLIVSLGVSNQRPWWATVLAVLGCAYFLRPVIKR